MATTASALLMLSPLPTMAAMEATTVATDTMASDLLRLSPRLLPLPTMATAEAMATTESALLMLSPLPTMATAEAMATMASALLMLSPRQSPRRSQRLLLNTTSLFTDTTDTMASAPLMLSLLPSTSMPTLPMDTTMVKAYSTPKVC